MENLAEMLASGMRVTANRPGEGRAIAVVGDLYCFLATGDETDGKYALWEATVPPGGGPPPHTHSREEEGFFILDGEIAFYVEGQRVVGSPGSFFNMPVGSLHAFCNESDRVARMLILVAPAGLEKMFFEVGVPVTDPNATPAPPTKEEIDRLLSRAPAYGIDIRLPH
jgi:quercetin dioxygenase-like cupin family protein